MLIGEFAKWAGLSHATIRNYEEIGLLEAAGRNGGNFRLYSSADLHRVRLIRGMRALRFSHDDIKQCFETLAVLQNEAQPASPIVRMDLADLIVEAERRRVDLRERVRLADGFVDMLLRQ